MKIVFFIFECHTCIKFESIFNVMLAKDEGITKTYQVTLYLRLYQQLVIEHFIQL